MVEHSKCAAKGCSEAVQTPRAFCRAHWNALPKGIKDAIWASHLKRKPNESAGYVDQARRYLATSASLSKGVAKN